MYLNGGAFGQESTYNRILLFPIQTEAKLRLELIREEVEELNVGIEGMDIVRDCRRTD